ncbi:S-layer homology domain-containing protein, partial [Intestinimonas aquisgranensis]
WRYAGSPKVDGSLSSFTDGAQTSSWAQPAMIWAVEQGLITGVGNDRLEPRGQATRAQAATILMRFAQDMAQ